jgi:hypothetical protein
MSETPFATDPSPSTYLIRASTTEYTELQPLLSGVHSVMKVKSVLAGEGGWCTPTPSHYFTRTSKVAVNAPAEWTDTLTLFHLYQSMYSVASTTPPSPVPTEHIFQRFPLRYDTLE